MWTFVLNDVEFREMTELIKVDKVKIVACDGKSKCSLNCENVTILNCFYCIDFSIR